MTAAASSGLAAFPKEFVKSGWTHQQIERQGNVAIYKRWREGKQGFAREEHYEVIVIHQRPAHDFRGKHYPATERYPSSSQWGDMGWTVLDREKALKKFNQIALSGRNV